jgi:DNA-binding NarL/FixJ family response regulator
VIPGFKYEFSETHCVSALINIITVHRSALWRHVLALALNGVSPLRVIAETENSKTLIKVLQTTKPDIVLLEFDDSAKYELENLNYLLEHHSELRIILTVTDLKNRTTKELIKSGVKGFIPVSSSFETLIGGIISVQKTGHFLDEIIDRYQVEELNLRENKLIDRKPIFDNFEENILKKIALEKLPDEIAEELSVCRRTVERCCTKMLKKSGTKTIAGLVIFAMKNKLL